MLQQQTVRNLQAAIRPLHPPPTRTLDKNLLVSKRYGSLQGHSTDDKLLTSNKPRGGWAKVAYVQILRDRTQACTAVMLFAELEHQESMAQRIIIYPEEWHLERGKRVDSSSPVKTSLRLLENAASRYKVLLQPVGKIHNFPKGMSELRSSTIYQAQKFLDTDEAAYPLFGLLSLSIFDRLIYLRPSGLIIDSADLDLLFTLPMESSILGISGNSKEEFTLPSIVIFEPSIAAYNGALSAISIETYSDDEFLRHIPQMSGIAGQGHLVTRTSAMSLEINEFTAAEFFQLISYVHLTDPDFPGPEFDIPSKTVVRARPKLPQHREIWERVYEIFRERRMSICGLDLEPFPVMVSKGDVSLEPVRRKERP